MSKVNVLSREQILSAPGFKRRLLYLEAWGGHVWVREMSMAERNEYQVAAQALADSGENGEVSDEQGIRFMAGVVSSVVLSEDGQPLLSLDDAVAIGDKSLGTLQEIIAASTALSQVTVPEAKKNLKNDLNGSRRSGSQKS